MTPCGFMWDSTTPAVIPSFVKLRALYANGRFAAPLHFGRGRIYIDVNGTDPENAGILDVETGDASPSQVGPWLARRNRISQGVIYCNRSNLAAVQASAGAHPTYIWLATLDGTVPSIHGHGTLVAVQAYGASVVGCNADVSVVVNQEWWRERALP